MNSVLLHLAVVADLSSPSKPGAKKSAVAAGPALLELFSMIAGRVFDAAPRLRHLSLFSPQMQEWFSGPPPTPKTLNLLAKGLLKLGTAGGRDSTLTVFGSLRELPPDWRDLFRSVPRGQESARQVNLFVNYSGRREICEAARKSLRTAAGDAVDEELFSSCLLTANQPDPDLVIFAGGVLEPKDFLLWQSSYAEIWHTPGSGLDFGEGDLAKALEDFTSRQRRFGLV